MVIADHDPAWAALAGRAGEELTAALPGLFRAIEHVGSTSVPGLAAKPIIDLMASVDTLEQVTPERAAVLARLGYVPEETGMTGRFFYYRADGAGRRAFHLHVVTAASWPTRNERLLRDHLRAHPEAAAEYAAVKRRLAAERRSSLEYTKGKTEVIQRLIDREREARGLPRVDVWED
ncbi:GrpB family protein [Streptomyces sp. MP131-18]|uniref:GrpB family protein n=1 Tax=Streptomyces sp. MP131-18 TaxID=1857892 RepID=UPI00097C7717|nr:GrpB family protein [Streptomyces sp. MP131-18]ONK10702.1 dephospho-CoA kinase/protein folding accessory domain-containing protein [Streptomyces sp. MP131-18]